MSPDSPPPPRDGSALDRQALLAALRARAARVAATSAESRTAPIAIAPAIDAALPGGGLARAGLHEVIAADPDAAAGFCAVLLGRTAAPVFWIGPEPEAWPAGLARYGLPAASLVMVRAAGEDAIWAMEEALRCAVLGGALLMAEEVTPDIARRLLLAAETGGGLALLLRPDDGAPAIAAAGTAWRLSSLPGAHVLGDPRWGIELLRCRGGASRSFAATWRASLDRLDLDAPAEAHPDAAPPRRAGARRH